MRRKDAKEYTKGKTLFLYPVVGYALIVDGQRRMISGGTLSD